MRAHATSATAHVRNRLHRSTDDDEATVARAIAGAAPTTGRLRDLGPTGVLALQRVAGNRAVRELLGCGDGPRSAVQRDDDASTMSSPLPRGVRLLPAPSWLAVPDDFLRTRPSLVPPGGLRPLPATGVEGLIDWGVIGTAYQDRQLVLQDRDRSVIVGHWQRWYPVAQGLHKLPIARSLFDSPAAIMNTMSAKMVDSSLAGDRPNMVEMFDRRAEQFGVHTTTVSVTVGHF